MKAQALKIHPEFPRHRLKNPKRRAEKRLYDQLAQSDVPGYTLYEAYPGGGAPQLDFGVWLGAVARIAAQCKGGEYRVHRGEWQLRTSKGWEHIKKLSQNLARCPTCHSREDRNPFTSPIDFGQHRGNVSRLSWF